MSFPALELGSIPDLASASAGGDNSLFRMSFELGERDGARTHDLLIKSQLLYRLSYALPRGRESRPRNCGEHRKRPRPVNRKTPAGPELPRSSSPRVGDAPHRTAQRGLDSVRRTASRQPASLAARRSPASIVGSKRRSSAQRLANPSGLRPDAACRAGKPSRTQRRRLQDRRPVDGRIEDVGQALHRPVGRDHAAIDAQHRRRRAPLPVLAHRVEQVAGLEGHRLERRAGKFAPVRNCGSARRSRRAPRHPNTARRARQRPAPDRPPGPGRPRPPGCRCARPLRDQLAARRAAIARPRRR